MWQKTKNIYHLILAMAANIYFGNPSRNLKVIGVTGTDGKTTTSSLIYHILKAAGKKAALICTVGAYIGDHVNDIGFHVTNPAPFPLQRFIRQAKDTGNEYLVLEVTSHGLDQNRVFGIHFNIGILTNITREHLDYHRTKKAYTQAKFKLPANSDTAILNYDDASYGQFMKRFGEIPNLPASMKRRGAAKMQHLKQNPDSRSQGQKTVISYSINNIQADINTKNFPFKSDLIGDFNISNCLAAIAACRYIGIPDAVIRDAVATFRTPVGRQETVFDGDFRVIVDFAHTPNGFAQLLPAVKKLTHGRLIQVFGSAGKRDKEKRPLMGNESAKYADVIILTAEDPRDESITEINDGIKAGIKGFTPGVERSGKVPDSKIYFEIQNRREAISYAIGLARKGDTVLITGKAHEKSMNYGQGETPWDEFAAVTSALESHKTK